jgi:hypothetical protein
MQRGGRRVDPVPTREGRLVRSGAPRSPHDELIVPSGSRCHSATPAAPKRPGVAQDPFGQFRRSRATRTPRRGSPSARNPIARTGRVLPEPRRGPCSPSATGSDAMERPSKSSALFVMGRLRPRLGDHRVRRWSLAVASRRDDPSRCRFAIRSHLGTAPSGQSGPSPATRDIDAGAADLRSRGTFANTERPKRTYPWRRT